MEEHHRTSSWMSSGNLRLAVIAIMLLMCVVATSWDPASATVAAERTAPVIDAARPSVEAPAMATATPEPTVNALESPEPPAVSPADTGGVLIDLASPNPVTTDGSYETTVVVDTPGLDATGDFDATATCLLPTADEADTSAWFLDEFDSANVDWQPLSGVWSVDAGVYTQTDPSGYDFITQLALRPPPQFRLEVDIAPVGALNAGVIVGQPEAGTRAGATIIDFTESGRFLRWGSYDASTGQYRYGGGAPMLEDFAPELPHTLSVDIRTDRTYISVDGREVASIDPVGSGRVGLVTSVSSAAFDNLVITELS